MDLKALHQLSYGMFIVSSKIGTRYNGQIANTVFQVTSTPPTIGVSICNQNYTYEFIKASGVFAVSVLAQDAPAALIGQFGFKCGRNLNKFTGAVCRTGVTGVPIVTDHATAYLECEVISSLAVGTHTIFVGKVVAAEELAPGEPMTYAYYHRVRKGTVPKSAPHYIPPAPASAPAGVSAPSPAGAAGQKYRCTVCNYIYDPAAGDPEHGIPAGTPFEQIPDSWVCPVCGVDKSNFVKEG